MTGVEVGPSRLGGRGVFATAPIEQGALVERCIAIEVDEIALDEHLGDYVFSGRRPGTSAVVLGLAMVYNHGHPPNVAWYWSGVDEVRFRTLRDIEPGEELLHDYGSTWWSTRDREPAVLE